MNHVDVRSSLKMAGLAMVLAVGSLACSQRVEDNPVVKAKFNELEKTSQELKKTQREVAMLQQDMDALSEAFNGAVKSLGPDGSPETASKIADLDKQLAALEARASSLGGGSRSDSKEVADAGSSSSRSDDVKSASSSKAKTSASASTKKAAKLAVEKPSAPRGFYYTTKTGDTFESIASRNNISVTRLKEANRLRGSATLYPAQPIYIPTK